jgi:DNA invertase Pin-like site-specific DNA recombinase
MRQFWWSENHFARAVRRFDVVLAWALDRRGRSLMDLLHTLSALEAVGVALVLLQQAIDTTTPAGRMFFQVTGAFADFERAMIRSRARAGLERARARGERLRRPPQRIQGGGGHARG